jgi:hypothetical protein
VATIGSRAAGALLPVFSVGAERWRLAPGCAIVAVPAVTPGPPRNATNTKADDCQIDRQLRRKAATNTVINGLNAQLEPR